MAVDAAGDVFVADTFNNQVVELSPPTVAATPSPLTGSQATAVLASLTGLSPDTLYYYRAVASGPGGTVAAPALSFTTQVATAFANLTGGSIPFGAASVNLSGQLLTTPGTPLPTGSVVTISIDGVAETAALNPDGSFQLAYQFSQALHNFPLGVAQSPYAITYAFTDPSGRFAPASDSSQSLTINAASTTTTPGNATATFSESNQSVTLTADVTSTAGPVNEGTVTFTVLQGGTVIGSAVTSDTVHNGQARVVFVLPGGAAPGTYTIDADCSDLAGNFVASGGMASLTVNAAAATTLQLTGVSIVPNLSGGTAQVTLTAQVSNPAGTVNGGVVTFTLADVSAQGVVQNGTASAQLVVPLVNLAHNLAVQLTIQSAYAENATLARFGPGNAAPPLVLEMWNALRPSSVTLTADGGEVDTVPFLFAPLEFFYVNQRWTEFRYGPIDLHVGYANLNGMMLVTPNGVPWQLLFFGPQDQFLGAVTLALSDNSALTFLLSGALWQIIGTGPV